MLRGEETTLHKHTVYTWMNHSCINYSLLGICSEYIKSAFAWKHTMHYTPYYSLHALHYQLCKVPPSLCWSCLPTRQYQMPSHQNYFNHLSSNSYSDNEWGSPHKHIRAEHLEPCHHFFRFCIIVSTLFLLKWQLFILYRLYFCPKEQCKWILNFELWK